MCQWRRVEAMLKEKGPFFYTLARTSCRLVPI
jgi:hypothetical protein